MNTDHKKKCERENREMVRKAKGTRKAVGYYPRRLAESLYRPMHIISIGEANDGLNFACKEHTILRLEFADITEPVEDYPLFSFSDARRIIEWVKALPSSCKMVVVHCEAGFSRSAAVAQFMVKDMGFELHVDLFSKKDFALANPHVYGTLRRTYMELKNV